MLSFQKKNRIFAQGEPTDGLFFIQEGKVRLSVVSEGGKEATLGILHESDFFGEGGLAGQLLRMSSATAMTDCVLLHIEKKAMMRAMSLEPKLSAMFLKYLLKRNIRYQDDLVDKLFNSSEKRLARVVGDNLHVHSSLLNVVLHDDNGTRVTAAARNPGSRFYKGLEPPAEPGEPADKKRARRPPLPSPK